MKVLSFIFFRIGVGLIAILPFRICYVISDVLSFLMFHVFKYRYKIALNNLTKSFPEKGQKEIKSILRKSYINLSDVLIEGLIGIAGNSEKINSRYIIENAEIFDALFEEKKAFIASATHYNNWEWMLHSFPFQLKHDSLGLYRNIKNPYIDRFVEKRRKTSGYILRSNRVTRKAFLDFKDSATAFILITDQSPANVKRAHWVQFLNQKTAFIHGIDKLSRVYQLPVYFYYPVRTGRGRYKITFELLCEDPWNLKPGALSCLYAKRLEEVIKTNPANWLWTHKRWKKKYADQELIKC